MPDPKVHISNRGLRTPRAAAIAGIIFALLYGTSYTLIQISLPYDPLYTGDWLEGYARTISLALSMLPFAGIAFLWFMGVVRDRMGHLEDQFFSTLFFGSGLLYLAMTFIAASVAGGLLAIYAFDPGIVLEGGFSVLSRVIIYNFNIVYAIRMAGMHMMVLGTIWFRTQVMPRWLVVVTYLLALVLLISIGFSSWVMMIFPAWVFLISAYILVLNFRTQKEEVKEDGLTVKN